MIASGFTGNEPATRLIRDDALDGVRAVAIAMVVLIHLSARWAPGGWIGVDIFFVLSGFLITGLIATEIDRMGGLNVARFYGRRALRLWPAFGVMVAACMLVDRERPAFGLTTGDALYAVGFTTNWANAFGWTSASALAHCWSLAVEQQFYLLWPLILIAVPARRRVATTLLLLGIAVAWRCWLLGHGASDVRIYNGFDSHADPLLIGALLFFVDGRAPLGPIRAGGGRWLLRGASLLVVLAIPLAVLLTDERQLVRIGPGITATALGGAALIACARRPGWLRDVLGWRPLVIVGRLSYGIYLWHFPMLAFGRLYLHGFGLLVPLALSIVAAALSYRFVEQPFLGFAARVGARPAPSPVSNQVPTLGAEPA